MSPRGRGRGRGRGAAAQVVTPAASVAPATAPEEVDDPTNDSSVVEDPQEMDTTEGQVKTETEAKVENAADRTTTGDTAANGTSKLKNPIDQEFPYQVKVSPIADDYGIPVNKYTEKLMRWLVEHKKRKTMNFDTRKALQRYLATTFKVYVPKLYIRAKGRVGYLAFDNEKDQLDTAKVVNGHVFRRRRLTAELFDPKTQTALTMDDEIPLEPEISFEEEIVAETLPLHHLDYAEQNRVKFQDAELMCTRLHGLLCSRNEQLAGWAEAMVDSNDGHLVKIEPLIKCPIVNGYRNKAKFRVGKSATGEIAVGFGMNDYECPVLGVEPNDRMLHCPDNMKLAAKLFRTWLADGARQPYDKRKKTGSFEFLLVRVTPAGSLMLGVIASDVNHTADEMKAIKADLKEYFINGPGAACNVHSLYLQILQDIAPIYPREKLELLAGSADYEEQICGLKFSISPFSILNLSPASSENIYNSVIELLQPTPDLVIVDACAGSCGIAFTLANKVLKAYAIEPNKEVVRDAKKTQELNNIQNVEIIEGKCEDQLEKIFAKEKNSRIVVIIDPPRDGLPTTIMALIRAQENVKSVVYVCSNTKTGVKNFLDLASRPGLDSSSTITYTGIPFLPKRCIPIDCTPYTPNTTVPILFERVDPSTFPAATRPVPVVTLSDFPGKKNGSQRKKGPKVPKGPVEIGKEPVWKRHLKNRRGGGGSSGGRLGGRGGGRDGRRRHGGPPMQRGPRYNQGYGNMSSRRPMEMDFTEQAFKAGLQAGWQAAASSVQPPPPPNNFYNNQGYGNSGSAWQAPYGNGYGAGGGFGPGFNGCGPGFGGGYGGGFGSGGFGTDFTSDSYSGGGRGNDSSGYGNGNNMNQSGGGGNSRHFPGSRFSSRGGAGGSGRGNRSGGGGGRGGPSKRARR